MMPDQHTRGEVIYLTRDCRASMVPSGAIIVLQEGTEVLVTQQLGNSYTVNVYGNLARIEGCDADALDKEPHDSLQDMPEDASVEDKMWAQLKTVFDPEIPVNIVDLGLIYTCKATTKDEGGALHADITMTLTSPGCGMGPVIADDAKNRVLAIPEISSAEVEIVFDPPWDDNCMSEAAKLELGWM
jgi:probable FeS assembly SUF system protein SufT